MYKLVEGPDGRVLKDLYFIKNQKNPDNGLFLMSEDYRQKLFIHDYAPGWPIEGRAEISNDLALTLLQAFKDLGKETYSKLYRGWWFPWSAPLANGYRLIEADNFLIGEL